MSDGSRRIAVIVEPAHRARITPLLMAAYWLTEREQDVTRLVLQGSSTAQIGSDLFISPHAVQEHLENVFEKTGVRSRRDLVGKVLFSHYLFVHHSGINGSGFHSLAEGAKVTYDAEAGDQGPKAVNVTVA